MQQLQQGLLSSKQHYKDWINNHLFMNNRNEHKSTFKSDEEYIKNIREGDDVAIEKLIMKYKSMVVLKARQYFLQGGDQEDLIQEGMIGLYKAISSFDSNKNVPFNKYAAQVVDSRLYDAIRKAARRKHEPLNQSLSLDYPLNQDESLSNDTMMNVIEHDSVTNPESKLVDQERVNQLNLYVKDHLSEFEYQVMTLYLQGKKYNEMAEILAVSNKSIDGALQRIRKKVMIFREIND